MSILGPSEAEGAPVDKLNETANYRGISRLVVPGGALRHSLFGSADYPSDVRMDGGKAWFWPSSDDIEVWMRFQFEGGGKSEAEVLLKELARVKKQN